MAPAEVHILIADLVRAGTDADLVGRVAAAIATGVSVTSQASPDVAGVSTRKRSAGAIRTARWRSKRRMAGLSRSVTSQVSPAIRANAVPVMSETPDLRDNSGAGQVSAGVTPVSIVASQASPGVILGQKETPPDPHKKNTPQRPPRFRRRHAAADEPSVLINRSVPDRRGRLWVDAADPVYLDLQAHSPTRSLPGAGKGWWFTLAEIAAAKARLSSKVAVLSLGRSGTGPPSAQAATGEARKSRA